MHPAVPVFEIRIAVTPADIDVMDHVNNVAYLRWVQEVAIAHWRSLTTPEEQQQWLWVVLRHEIDYKQPAVLGDEIVARTWVGPLRSAVPAARRARPLPTVSRGGAIAAAGRNEDSLRLPLPLDGGGQGGG